MYFRPLWRLANKFVGLRPVNPLSVDVTSAVLEELAKLDLPEEATEAEAAEGEAVEDVDGLIKAAMENKEALVLTSSPVSCVWPSFST